MVSTPRSFLSSSTQSLVPPDTYQLVSKLASVTIFFSFFGGRVGREAFFITSRSVAHT